MNIDSIRQSIEGLMIQFPQCCFDNVCFKEFDKVVKLLEEHNYDEVLTRSRRILELIVMHELSLLKKDYNKYGDLNAQIRCLKQLSNIPKLILIHFQVIKELGNIGAHPYQNEIITEVFYSVISVFKVYMWHRTKDMLCSNNFKTNLYDSLNLTSNIENVEFVIFNNVNEIYSKLFDCIENESKMESTVMVKNIGLDWETTWPQLRYNLLDRLNVDNIHYYGLIISPTSQLIKKYCKDVISPQIAEISINKVNDYVINNRASLNQRNIKLEIKKYSELPKIHGFNVNDKYLFLSFTEFKNDELTGGDNMYMFFKYVKDNSSMFYLSVFNSWFNYFWNQ